MSTPPLNFTAAKRDCPRDRAPFVHASLRPATKRCSQAKSKLQSNSWGTHANLLLRLRYPSFPEANGYSEQDRILSAKSPDQLT